MIDNIGQPYAFLLLLFVPYISFEALRSYADRSRQTKLAIAALRSAICHLIVFESAGITCCWKGKAGD
tara:strand:+ start:1246 stop:1449 length:204 start_codon:yes stop_codon:yes gene_type:complete